MLTARKGQIPFSVGQIEGGFEQLSKLINTAAGREEDPGLASAVINTARHHQKDATRYRYGVSGFGTLAQNPSLKRASEARKAGSAAVVAERKDKKAAARGIKVQLFAQLYEFPSGGKPMRPVRRLYV